MEKAEKILECVERRENGWIQPFGGQSLQQCVTVSFGKGAILDGLKGEEKFFEGEVFSNSSGDTKVENHVQGFPSNQCWFSLQQIKMKRQCQQTRILLQDNGVLLLPKCPRPIQDIYFPSRSH